MKSVSISLVVNFHAALKISGFRHRICSSVPDVRNLFFSFFFCWFYLLVNNFTITITRKQEMSCQIETSGSVLIKEHSRRTSPGIRGGGGGGGGKIPSTFILGGLILIWWCGSCTVGCQCLHKPVFQSLNWNHSYTYTSALPPTDFGSTALRVCSFHSSFRLISHIKLKLWLKSVLSGKLFLN